MQVKVISRSSQRVVLGTWLVLGAVALATMPPAKVEGAALYGSAASVEELAETYRDGEQLFRVVRTGEQRHGLARLRIDHGSRSFTAWVGKRAVVQLRASHAAPALAALLARHRLRLVRPLSEALALYLVESRADEDGAAIATRLREASELTVVPDLLRHKRRHGFVIPPNDPRYGGQWYLESLQIEDAWRLSQGARDITIAVLDDGCDMDHPDLASQLVGGLDVLDGDDDASFSPSVQGNEHGTACAGIAAAAGDNGVGITGTCPGCTLSCVRLIGGKNRLVPLSADIDAFEYAFRTNAAVISNSWGFVEPGPVSAPLASAIARVANEGFFGRGAVVVFAAGNENRSIADDELAALPDVLAVGAVNRFDEAAPFANYGRALDLSAPTGSLTTDIAGPDGAESGDYTTLFGGTSAACPVVAGVAGLLRAAAPQASARQVREALVGSARKAPFATPASDGQDSIYGYGILDPVAALRALAPGIEPLDAGVRSDAGTASTVDAGGASPAPDAAVRAPVDVDGSTATDAATSATNAPVDAGTAGTRRGDGGCTLSTRSTRSTRTSVPWAELLVLMVCFVVRGRSRARARARRPRARTRSNTLVRRRRAARWLGGAMAASLASEPSSLAAQASVAEHPRAPSGDEAPIDVVVTGRRSEERLGDSAVAVEVITREQIVSSGARDAAQVLATQAGVQIDSSFRGDAILLQGLDPQHTLILVDGERLVGARDGALDLTRMFASDIERIEIVRGPASAIYGSDAMAGVVNIITRVPREKPGADAQGRYGVTRGSEDFGDDLGHHGDAWLSAYGGVHDKLRGRVSIGYRRNAGYDLSPETPATTGNQLDSVSANARASYTPSPRFSLPMFARATRREATGIDQGSGGLAIYDRTQRGDDVTVTVVPSWTLRERDKLSVAGSYAYLRSQYLRDQRLDDDGDSYEDASEQLGTFRVQSDVALHERVFVTSGVEAIGQRYSSPRLSRDGRRARFSPYAQLEYTFLDRPGLSASLVPSARLDVDTQYGLNVSPRVALRCDPGSHLVLRASVGRGFRAPSFTELLLDFANPAANYRVAGNQDLKPERSIGSSISAELRGFDKVSATINLFRNDLRDLIDTRLLRVEAGEQLFGYDNFARVRTQGVETMLSLRPVDGLTIEGTYTLTETRDLERERPLSGRALQRGSARVVYGGEKRRFMVSARCVVVGRRKFFIDEDSGTTTVRSDPYAVLDLRGSLKLGAYVEPFVSIENATNTGNGNVPMRPATAYAGLDLHY